MKHHDPYRPVGKCKGCCLNMRTTCAAALKPKSQWEKGRCRYYGREDLLAGTYRASPEGAERARLRRKARARRQATLAHRNGDFDRSKLAAVMQTKRL